MISSSALDVLHHFSERPNSHYERDEPQKDATDHFGLPSTYLIERPKYFGVIVKVSVDEDRAEDETSECGKDRRQSRDGPDGKARPAIEPRAEI